MSEMKVALQVYTIREHLQTLDDFAESMKQVADIGYRFVELAGVGPIELEDQRSICDDNGLTVIAAHTPYQAFRDNIDSVADAARTLGAQWAVVPGLPGELRTADGYAEAAAQMTESAERLKDSGIGLAYHNHDMEFEAFDGRLAMDILIEESGPRVAFELDTYWVQHGGGSPAGWTRKLGGRVPLLHLKDFEIRGGEQLFAEIGEGNLDWPGIFDAAKAAGTQWLIVEEDTCTRPSMESIAISFSNLQQMGMC